MWSFGALCDSFFVSTRLQLKLDLAPGRETLLHFMEQMRRKHTSLRRFRRRDDGAVVLDDDDPLGRPRRFLRLDGGSLKFGVCDPEGPEQVQDFAETVLKLAPCHLSLSELDYDHVETVIGFDLEYCGNHDELIAESLFGAHPLLQTLAGSDRRVIECQPCFGVALNDACDLQAYVEVRSRTSTCEVRADEYPAAALSVFATVRRYWDTSAGLDLSSVHRTLLTTAAALAEERVVPSVVRPLAEAIGSRQ
jgi:hypothetical protein